MDNGLLVILICVGFAVFVYMITSRGPSQKQLDRETQSKRHEIEIEKLRLESEKLERQAKQARASSGKGKVFKAKR